MQGSRFAVRSRGSAASRFGIAAAAVLTVLAPALAAAGGGATVSGVVRDPTGAGVPQASVSLSTGDRDVWGGATTDASGGFEIREVAPGRYLLLVVARGFAEARRAVSVEPGRGAQVEVTLGTPALETEITVTADRGLLRSAEDAPQPVSVIGGEEIAARAKSVVAQAAAEETGVHLQRTSPTIAGIFVRGLTGNKVNVFLDGARFSTSAMRGGINTFLDLVDASALDSVEVLRGPQSAQYGSDALGGSVQFLLRSPSFSSGRPRWEGGLATHFNSADLGAGGSLRTSYSAGRFGLTASVVGRRASTLRAGEGEDSHNALTRFFGVSSKPGLDEGRLPDTAFTQYGGLVKAAFAAGPGSQLRLSYLRSQQDGGKRYDQLLGGDGNLVADLRNLMLDNLQVKYDRVRLGWLDELSLVYTWNAQREERVNQGGNGNPRAAINHEYEKTRVNGGQALLRKQAAGHALLLGGELYAEAIEAPSFASNPVTGATGVRRGRVPDGADYTSGGAYLQDTFEAVPEKLQLVGALRWNGASYAAHASDSPLVSGKPLWPDDSYSGSGFAFRAGLAFRASPSLTLTAGAARGFRAPHVTDLGTYGLTGSGYEVAAPDVAGRGALLGTTADRNAVSTGIPVAQVTPETSLSYEAAVVYRTSRVRARLGGFVNDIGGNLTKQALILPPGAVGTTLADQVIVAQTAAGAVFVPASSSPVLVRANYDDARLVGLEGELEARPTARLTLAGLFSYIQAKDRRTGLPPNIEGGTPAPDGWLRVRCELGRGRAYLEPYLHVAATQERLSTLDLEDRRTGATRSRASIASFFANGATARGFVGPGPDGRPGTADDVLLATGETLAQIQARVLGGAASAPLFTSVPGYAVLGLRAGLRFGVHELLVDLENLGDHSYRGISWGLDAPGRGLYLRYSTRF